MPDTILRSRKLTNKIEYSKIGLELLRKLVLFLVLALASGLVMPYFSKIKRHMMLLKKIGGFLIVLMGILLLLGQVNVLAGIFE